MPYKHQYSTQMQTTWNMILNLVTNKYYLFLYRVHPQLSSIFPTKVSRPNAESYQTYHSHWARTKCKQITICGQPYTPNDQCWSMKLPQHRSWCWCWCCQRIHPRQHMLKEVLVNHGQQQCADSGGNDVGVLFGNTSSAPHLPLHTLSDWWSTIPTSNLPRKNFRQVKHATLSRSRTIPIASSGTRPTTGVVGRSCTSGTWMGKMPATGLVGCWQEYLGQLELPGHCEHSSTT
jgi:hypothetical protein